MIAYTEGIWFLFLPDFSSTYAIHITYGRFAFLLFLLIWITSAFLRDKMSYRPWLYIHYLSYPLMAFVFIHAFQIGTYIFTIPFIKWYWIFLTGIFSVLVVWRLTRILNLDKVRYEVVSKEHKPDKITVYTLKPRRKKKLKPDTGQFIYIKPTFFGEAHPFSVLKYDEKTGEISFGIKAVGQFTRILRDIDINQTVYLEGPYGVFTKEGQNTDHKVIFAGGIGIVPFYELVKRFGGKKTIMFYSNKKLEDALYREEFAETLGSSYIDAVTREDPKDVKGNTVLKGRITEDIVKSYLNNEFLSKGKFFICGSPGFMAGITKILKDLGVPQSRVHMEEFGF
jgi:predicted ferric reductase